MSAVSENTSITYSAEEEVSKLFKQIFTVIFRVLIRRIVARARLAQIAKLILSSSESRIVI